MSILATCIFMSAVKGIKASKISNNLLSMEIITDVSYLVPLNIDNKVFSKTLPYFFPLIIPKKNTWTKNAYSLLGKRTNVLNKTLFFV